MIRKNFFDEICIRIKKISKEHKEIPGALGSAREYQLAPGNAAGQGSFKVPRNRQEAPGNSISAMFLASFARKNVLIRNKEFFDDNLMRNKKFFD